MNSEESCLGDTRSSDGLELEHLPPSVIVAVYDCLSDAGEVLRAATVCRSVWVTISAAQIRQVSSISFKCFHPELQNRIPHLVQQFPSIKTLNLSNCSAIPETWLSPAAAAWQIRDLDVTRLWLWTGSVCLQSWAGALTRLVVDGTSFPILKVIKSVPSQGRGNSLSSATPLAAETAAAAAAAGAGYTAGGISNSSWPSSGDGTEQQHHQQQCRRGQQACAAPDTFRRVTASSKGVTNSSSPGVQVASRQAATDLNVSQGFIVQNESGASLDNHHQQQQGQQCSAGQQQQGQQHSAGQQQQQRHREKVQQQDPLAWLPDLCRLCELSCRGLVVDPVRCKTHGSTDCQCEENTVLAAILANNRDSLTHLDLSCNPQLPDRLLHWTLTGTAVGLTTLDISGCDLIRPGYVGSCCLQLQWLDVSGTAAGDADVAMIADGILGLKHLNLKGCRQVSDIGVSALAHSPSVLSGQLQYLNIGNLTRTHSAALVDLMTAWIAGIRGRTPTYDSSSSSSRTRSGSSTCSSSGGPVCEGLSGAAPAGVHLGLSYTAGASDAVLEGFAAAAATAAATAAAAARQGAPRVSADSARAAAVAAAAAANGGRRELKHEEDSDIDNWLNDVFDSACVVTEDSPVDLPAAAAAAGHDVAAAVPAAANQMPQPAHTESPIQHIFKALPIVGLSGLELSGCNNVSGLMLQHVASLGLLSGLRVLDLSDMEDLRSPKTLSPVTRTAAAAAAAAAAASVGQETSANSAAAAAAAALVNGFEFCVSRAAAPDNVLGQMFNCMGGQVTSLTLDGCYLDDETAGFIAMQCPRLQHLSLVGCRGLQSAGLQALVNSRSSSSSSSNSSSSRQGLRSLAIGGSSSAWRESEALSGLSSLTELRLFRRSRVTDAELTPVLAANQRLQRLTLVGCYSLMDDLFNPVLDSQQQQQQRWWQQRQHASVGDQLTYLSLGACDGIQGLTISRLRALCHLRVSFCASFSKAAVQQLVVACKNLTLLELPARFQGQVAAQRWLPQAALAQTVSGGDLQPVSSSTSGGSNSRHKYQAARVYHAADSAATSRGSGFIAAGGAGGSRGGVVMPQQGPGGHLHGLKVVCV